MRETTQRAGRRARAAAQGLRSLLDWRHLTDVKLAVGRLETRQVVRLEPSEIERSEFRVFSQWGEDGIIQFLLHHCNITVPTFIEFGVESYRESNTRFLLQNDFWRGLIIDGSGGHRRFLQLSGLSWRHDISAITSFITAENIDELIRSSGIAGEIGILSVDVDGVDYWILESITAVSPQMVIVEYNGFFGPELAVTVPYNSEFRREEASPSRFYWGASLRAFDDLLGPKGYALVYCNRAGNNAFFVRRDCLGDAIACTVDDAFRSPSYWEQDVRRDPDEMFRMLGALQYFDLHLLQSLSATDLGDRIAAAKTQR